MSLFTTSAIFFLIFALITGVASIGMFVWALFFAKKNAYRDKSWADAQQVGLRSGDPVETKSH